MSQITGGRVVFSRTVQPAQYESKRAEVELTFVLAEGEDLAGTLNDVSMRVRGQVLDILGISANPAKKPDRRRGYGEED